MDYNKFETQDQRDEEQGHVVNHVDSAGNNRPDQTAYPQAPYQAQHPYAYQQYSTGAPEKSRRRERKSSYGQAPSEKKGRGRRALSVVAAVLAACIVGGSAGAAVSHYLLTPHIDSMSKQITSLQRELEQSAIVPTSANTDTTNSNKPTVNEDGDYSVAEVADLASPAVVAIGTKALQETVFGYQTVMAAGSGVIISSDGYIVTNNHVVEGSKETTVTLASGDEYKATIIGTDPTTDLAVIKIDEAVEVPFLRFGSSEEMSVGETVVAIGNPLGEFEGTVTDGVISGKNRAITIENQQMLNLIQTNAAINSGNSGGALLNLRGEVIGINSAKTAAVGVEGIAFAIPSETVIPTVEQLIEHGEVIRPMLGIFGQSVPNNSYGLPQGVMVTEVSAGSSAARAGIRQSDIITAVNGNPVTSVNDINAYKAHMMVGDTMVLDIYRDGEELTIDLVLEAP